MYTTAENWYLTAAFRDEKGEIHSYIEDIVAWKHIGNDSYPVVVDRGGEAKVLNPEEWEDEYIIWKDRGETVSGETQLSVSRRLFNRICEKERDNNEL